MKQFPLRGIPAHALDALLAYGHRAHAANGCSRIWLGSKDQAQLAAQLPRAQFAALRDRVNLYAVVDAAGGVVTVGFMTKRATRH